MKKFFLYIMAVFYICAGVNHFWHPQDYIKIMPSYIPFHTELVYISGVVEILCGLLLIPIRTRRTGAWLTILLLIAVFPANIQMAINYYNENNPDLWIAITRLPVQIFLIWWASVYAKKKLKYNI
ncbi:MAG: DoxX family protein [Ignavibacteria bacterium]|nr:DoxX family protein [Ignavibacteria bacterium]